MADTEEELKRISGLSIEELKQRVFDIYLIFDSICKEHNIWYCFASGNVLGAVREKGFIPWDADIDVYVKVTEIDRLRKVMVDNLPPHLRYNSWVFTKNYPRAHDCISVAGESNETLCFDIFTLIGAPSTFKEQKRFSRKCYYSYKFFHCKHRSFKVMRRSSHKLMLVFLKPFAWLFSDAFIRDWYYKIEHQYDFDSASFWTVLASSYGIKDMCPKDFFDPVTYLPFEGMLVPVPGKTDEYLRHLFGDDYMTPKQKNYRAFKG